MPNATEIPRAVDSKFSGRSTAFDPNIPYNRVIVDPDTPESFEVNLAKADRKAFSDNTQASAEEVLRAVSETQIKAAVSNVISTPSAAAATVYSQPVPGLAEDVLLGEALPVSMRQAAYCISSLKIPFLTNGVPAKPAFTLYFDFGQFGTISARYHAVIENKDSIVLVYDTRFEYGQQYLPPSLSEAQAINLGVAETGKNYQVFSVGLHWSLGCLDFVVLLRG
jgi:hypothetical protein